jgi:hypothetical protein
MSPEKLSASELLEQAREIRAAADADGRACFDAREGEILRLAAAVEESRRRTGIGGLVDDFLGGILGEKRQAEARLAELRAREEKVEQLLRERAGAQAALAKATENRARTDALAAQFQKAGSTAGIREIFIKRTWAIGEANFAGHALEAAKEAASAKILAEHFGVFQEAATDAEKAAASNLEKIEGELRKIKK